MKLGIQPLISWLELSLGGFKTLKKNAYKFIFIKS